MIAEELVAEIRTELEKLGRGSRQGHRPSAQIDFGVYTADLRGVVRNFKKELKDESGKLVLQVANLLIDENVTECRQVAYELTAGHNAARELLNDECVIRLGRKLDNWCCVDNFCSNIAGSAWREGRISDSLINSWSQSDDLWRRRCAVVCTVALNTKSRGGTGDPARTVKVCERLISDPEMTVQKALSWALRELVPWDRSAVEAFLDQHNDEMSALVKREVKKKLETGKKNG